MIRSFRDRGLKRFADTGDGSKLSVRNRDRVRRMLIHLDEAVLPEEMNVAGWRFHAFKGREKGRFSVWVTGNYRLTFGWDGADAIDVDLEDYH
jgi:proteic killer suppression protein